MITKKQNINDAAFHQWGRDYKQRYASGSPVEYWLLPRWLGKTASFLQTDLQLALYFLSIQNIDLPMIGFRFVANTRQCVPIYLTSASYNCKPCDARGTLAQQTQICLPEPLKTIRRPIEYKRMRCLDKSDIMLLQSALNPIACAERLNWTNEISDENLTRIQLETW